MSILHSCITHSLAQVLETEKWANNGVANTCLYEALFFPKNSRLAHFKTLYIKTKHFRAHVHTISFDKYAFWKHPVLLYYTVIFELLEKGMLVLSEQRV